MGWLSWFKTETFCCVFSLQSGTVVSIMVLAALGITSFINIIYFLVTSSSFFDNIAPFCLALIYLVVLSIGLVFAFVGAYSESTFWMLMGSLFTGFAIIIYIIISALSFLSPMYSIACFSLRCPEHLWLQKSHWRSPENDANSELYNKENLAGMEDRELEPFEESTYSIIRSTSRPIRYRRLRPKPVTRASIRNNMPHLVEEEDKEMRQKEVHLCDKSQRKFAYEDEEVEYCPEEREEEESGSGIAVYSAIVSILYFISFVAFQLYCLYGFLCFANELKKELG